MNQCPSCGHLNAPALAACQNCGIPMRPGTRDPMLGRTINGFRLLELIGKGATGKVYRAEQISLNKEVAIKVLHKHLQSDPSLVKRFHREARAASRLNHPNCIQVIDFGQSDDDVLFIAMEYLAGENLGTIIFRDFPFAPDRLLRITEQVCFGLDEAHVQGIIHRDLKPENILLIDRRTERDLVKVLDFGIAKLQAGDGPSEGTITKAGNVCGTPEYMSPEQAQGSPVDQRCDIYSLGIILFQMVTKALPFRGETPLIVATQQIMDTAPHVRAVRPDLNIHPELDALIFRCMAKEPAQRPGTAAEVSQELRRILTPLIQPQASHAWLPAMTPQAAGGVAVPANAWSPPQSSGAYAPPSTPAQGSPQPVYAHGAAAAPSDDATRVFGQAMGDDAFGAMPGQVGGVPGSRTGAHAPVGPPQARPPYTGAHAPVGPGAYTGAHAPVGPPQARPPYTGAHAPVGHHHTGAQNIPPGARHHTGAQNVLAPHAGARTSDAHPRQQTSAQPAVAPPTHDTQTKLKFGQGSPKIALILLLVGAGGIFLVLFVGAILLAVFKS